MKDFFPYFQNKLLPLFAETLKLTLAATLAVTTAIASVLLGAASAHSEPAVSPAACIDAFDHSMRKLHSDEQLDLCALTHGRPLLIVNTASHCGFTKQFKGLENIHQSYKDRGLVVLGFASNDFRQAAKSEEKAAEVCYVNFGVTFAMISPTKVRGAEANPVFSWLAEKSRKPAWNFNKYLVSADRELVTHFGGRTKPSDAEFLKLIEQTL